MSILQSILRRPAFIVIAALAVVLFVFVLVWFQPQQLVLNREVNEALPGDSSQQIVEENEGKPRSADGKNANSKPKIEVVAKGTFRALAHPVSGQAKVLDVSGDRYLRFEDFTVENGPDLRVYLSAAPSHSDGPAFGSDFIDLGSLKGNVGDQNYRIPAGAELSRFRSAVIWCRRFSVGFAGAPISA
jgi:Electron transfer DM13